MTSSVAMTRNGISADNLCGVGTFRPKALQAFASAKLFTLLYSVVLIFQNAQFYYFFGIMSTLQRRYGLSSWSVSIILFAVSCSPFFISFAVGHYSKKVSRPVLLFWGTAALAASCCVCAVPYFVFGPGLAVQTQGASALAVCPAARDVDCRGQSFEPFVVAAVLFVANCLYGSAYSVLYIAGSTYVDDSVKKKNSPLHFAFMAIVKLLGPSLGYALAGLCLRYYEDPLYDPGLEITDPRWVGAWWLGYVMLAIFLAILSVPLLLFPKGLPRSAPPKHREDEHTKAKDKDFGAGASFFGSLKTLFRNRVYMLRLVYWLLVTNVVLGHGMMSAKYVEVQYRTSASKASFLSGPVLLLTNALGVGLGGLALHAFRPRAQVVASYTTLCDILKLCCYVACMLIGCQGIQMISIGLDDREQGSCSAACNCTTRSFQPICVPEQGGVFFSPCFAGCRNNATDVSVMLEDCTCLTNLSSPVTKSSSSRPYLGLCDEYCQNIIAFVVLMSMAGFITRTTTVAHTIFGLRCVDKHEKAMALGVQEGLSSIFTYVPYPLLYGAIFDWSCIVWQDACGRPGTCWVYDTDKLRYAYHGISSVILLVAVVFEVLMAAYSGKISNFYGEGVEGSLPTIAETECTADGEDATKPLTEADERC